MGEKLFWHVHSMSVLLVEVVREARNQGHERVVLGNEAPDDERGPSCECDLWIVCAKFASLRTHLWMFLLEFGDLGDIGRGSDRTLDQLDLVELVPVQML
jgi:hypothetical protein